MQPRKTRPIQSNLNLTWEGKLPSLAFSCNKYPSIFSPSVTASCHSILSTLHTLLYSTTTFYSLHTSPPQQQQQQQQPHHTTKPQLQSKCPSLVLPSSSAVLPSLVSDTTSTPLVETQELLRRRLRVRATTLYPNDPYTNLVDRRRSQRCCRHQEAPPWPHSWRRDRVERSWCQDRRCCKSMIYPSRHTQILSLTHILGCRGRSHCWCHQEQRPSCCQGRKGRGHESCGQVRQPCRSRGREGQGWCLKLVRWRQISGLSTQDESTCIIYLIKVGAYGTANGFERANGHAIALGFSAYNVIQ